MIAAVGDLIITEFRSEITKLPFGKEFLAAWDVFNTAMGIFGLGQMLAGGADLLFDLSGAYRKLSATEDGAKLLHGRANVLDGNMRSINNLAEAAETNPSLIKRMGEVL